MSNVLSLLAWWTDPLLLCSYCGNTWVQARLSPSACTNGYCYWHLKAQSGVAPFCNASDQRFANLYRASQGAPCSTLKLGVLQQYLLEPMPGITAVWSAQSTKINPITFSGWSQIISIISIVLPQTDQISSDLSAYHWFVPSWGRVPWRDIVLVWCLLKRVSWAITCVWAECLHVTNYRRSDHGSCILNFHAPDSNLEHPAFSAELFFFLITFCSWIITRKKSVHPLS